MSRRTLLVGVGLILAASACRSGAVVVDHAPLVITAPGDHDEVPLPLEMSWEFDGDAPEAGIAGYLVLVDKNPQPPGRSLVHFLPDDGSCVGTARSGCLTPDALQALGVHVTIEPKVTIPRIARRVGVSRGARDLHVITVVPLDANGFRVGEWSASVTVEVAE